MRLLRITTVPISLHLLLSGQFRYMIGKGYEVYTISADGPEVEEVLKEGVRHIAVPFTRKITLLHDLRCLITLIGIIRKIQPQIIHTHTPKAGLLGMLAGWICRVPVRMHTVAGLPLMVTTGLKRTLLETTEKITYACAQKIYPNSRGLEQFMLSDLNANPAKVKIIGKGSSNGIDVVSFTRTSALEAEAAAIRQKYGITSDDLVFAFVGRVVRDKGIVELVEAFKTVSEQFYPRRAYLILVGSFEQELDPLPEDIVKFITDDERVILPGFQHDVRPWIMASDAFVFPSYREGFPNVVMQACLLEIPSIVSDINGCNEIVSHMATGLVVPPRDVSALVKAMNILRDDIALRHRFSRAAREFVAANFDREYVWEQIRKEYERLASAT